VSRREAAVRRWGHSTEAVFWRRNEECAPMASGEAFRYYGSRRTEVSEASGAVQKGVGAG
jgi:hypothetical protein